VLYSFEIQINDSAPVIAIHFINYKKVLSDNIGIVLF